MSNVDIQTILELSHSKEVAEHVVTSFHEIERNFRLEQWKVSELDAGHFVESVRRLIDHQLFGNYTPFSESLTQFNQSVLNKYESATGAEEFRLLIPRVLYAMYCIRNKRGVGHISAISPNKLDASFILHSAKWVLAELVRLAGDSSPDDAKRLTDQIVERQIDVIWQDEDTFMVLDTKLRAHERALLCLYKEDRIHLENLQLRVGYSNKSKFRKIILEMEKKKLLALASGDIVKLSPLGVAAAEHLIND